MELSKKVTDVLVSASGPLHSGFADVAGMRMSARVRA